MRSLSKALLLAVVLLGATLVVAAPHHSPEDVVIDAAMAKRAAVEFPHRLHQKNVASCDTCHHQNEGLTAEADEEVEACSSCHLDPEDPETPSMRELSIKKNPFHLLCVDCHKTEEKGPTKCDECHPKADA